MKKILIILFILILTSYVQANDLPTNNLEYILKYNIAKNEQRKPFYKKWEKYLKKVTHISNVSHSKAVYNVRQKLFKSITEHEKNLIKIREIRKNNNFSTKWAKELRKKYTDKELKDRRIEINNILYYLNNKSEKQYLNHSLKDILYYGNVYFTLIKDYIRIFKSYYQGLSEADKNKNVKFYKNVIKMENLLKKSENFNIAFLDSRFYPQEEKVKNFQKKDLVKFLSSQKAFQKPFDIMKAVNTLFPM